MGAQMMELRGAFTDVLVITELRGSYPNVPIFADVDYDALIAGDDSPTFLTIPIGKANVKSGNARFYDEAWLLELERQVQSKKVIGLMGHLSPEERAWAFPEEAIHWIGVAREQSSGLLWAKGYIPPGSARDRIRRYKAQGKSIATSIACGPNTEGIWDESVKAYRMKAATMELEQIDIAPADRAGIPGLAAVPMLTTEMETSQEDTEQETHMTEKTKLDHINEMTAEDARLLPEPVRAAVLQTATPAPEVAQVQEIRAALGVDDKADLKTVVTEMRKVQEEQRQANIKTRIRELASDAEKGIKIVPVREVVIEMVEAAEPKTLEEAETWYNKVAQSGPITELLKSKVVQTMGPPQGTPLQRQAGANKYFQIPAEKQEA